VKIEVKPPESVLTSSDAIIEQSVGEDPENGANIKTKNSSSSGKLFSKVPNYKGATFRTLSCENKKETSLLAQANEEGYEGGNSGSNSGPSANNNN